MKRSPNQFARPYRAALLRYLKQGPAVSLQPALRLGRLAIASGLESLDLALIHEQALMAHALPVSSSAIRDRMIRRAGTFFAEAIIPMEETHRTALEANVQLNRLNRSLSQRTRELAASNRQLKKEVARRRVVETHLRKSEQHSILLLDQSRFMQEQLRRLSRGILSAQEEERKRISRELHDVIGQVLTSINVRLAVLKAEATINTKGLTKSIAHAQRVVEKSVNIVRKFAYNLRPSLLDDLGLVPCLDSFMSRFMQETGIRASLTAFAGVDKLSSARRTALYRVAQEALTNVSRHAQASRVDVTIHKLPGAVRMRITDDGKSFDVDRVLRSRKIRHLGLLGMKERVDMVGGKLTIESGKDRGTTVQAQVPFGNGAKEHSRP